MRIDCHVEHHSRPLNTLSGLYFALNGQYHGKVASDAAIACRLHTLGNRLCIHEFNPLITDASSAWAPCRRWHSIWCSTTQCDHLSNISWLPHISVEDSQSRHYTDSPPTNFVTSTLLHHEGPSCISVSESPHGRISASKP